MNRTHIDEGVLDFLIERFGVKSFLDVGCGPGGMLVQAEQRGLHAIGIDGDESVSRANIITHDYTKGPLVIEEEFDLIWSVEFLEHVDECYQTNYMTTFSAANLVFCTAAPPGKRGYHHVNCREVSYWLEVFASYGWRFKPKLTKQLRQVSTMRREFVRETGMAFVKIKPA